MKLFHVPHMCVNITFCIVGEYDNNVYLIDDSSHAILVDPSCCCDALMDMIGGRTLDGIILTHHHWDHRGAAAELRKRTNAPTFASRADAPFIEEKRHDPTDSKRLPACKVDTFLGDGQVLNFGAMAWRVIETPGHTPGSLCLFLDSCYGCYPQKAPVLISGDTLFYHACGRTDFYGGNPAQMKRSLQQLSTLPPNTCVLPGHGEQTTIAAEQRFAFRMFE